MNDEELRAFFEGAAGGHDSGDGDPQPIAREAAESSPLSAGDATQRRAAPSFDELLQYPPPSAAAAPPMPDQQLTPLILPDVATQPAQKPPLPPVFQASPTEPPSPTSLPPLAAEQMPAAAPYREPAPTQPYQVLADQAAPAFAGSVSGAPHDSHLESDPLAIFDPEFIAAPADTGLSGARVRAVSPVVAHTTKRSRKALPWVIVGAGVIIASVVSMVVIAGLRGGDSAPETDPNPATPLTPAVPQPITAPEESAPTPVPTPVSDAPEVDPGATWGLPIDQWNVVVEVSEKLGGSTPYTLFDDGTRALFDSLPVATGFSDACAAAREPNVWGLLRNEDGTLSAVRPEPRCSDTADAAVYDTIWGLLDHMAKTAQPRG